MSSHILKTTNLKFHQTPTQTENSKVTWINNLPLSQFSKKLIAETLRNNDGKNFNLQITIKSARLRSRYLMSNYSQFSCYRVQQLFSEERRGLRLWFLEQHFQVNIVASLIAPALLFSYSTMISVIHGAIPRILKVCTAVFAQFTFV